MTADRDSFEKFLLLHQDRVHATAFRLLGREAEAEDVCQDAFLRAWNHWAELDGNPQAGGWLRTVTRNLCLNHLERYRNRWRFFSELRAADAPEEDNGPADHFASPETWEAEVLNHDQQRILADALQNLPTDQRVALVLFHYEDLDYAEIARVLRVHLGKVKTDIHRGRAALLKKLQPRRGELGI